MSAVRRYRAAFGADLSTALVVIVAITVLGVPAGVLWEVVCPRVKLVVQAHDVYFANPEGSAFIATDGWFAVIGAAAGLLTAVAAFVRFRRNGVAAVIGLAAGGVLASLVAWKLGHLLGPSDVRPSAGSAPDGTMLSGPLQLRARGVLLVWSLIATTVFLALVAAHRPEERPENQPETEWAGTHPETERADAGPVAETDRPMSFDAGLSPGARWTPPEPE